MPHRPLLLLLLLVAWLPALRGQVTFEAYADGRQVLREGFLDVTFSLKNGRGTNFEPPAFEGFDLISGPRRASSTTIVNGQVSSETSFTYTLQARRLGRLTVGPARIVVEGETLTTEPISIEVVEGQAEGQGASDEPFYVRAIPNVDSAYLGQQVSLDYKLYTTTNIESYNVLEEADYGGFYAQDLKRFDSRVMREVIDGQQYTTKVLKRVALFPQQAGTLTVDPMRLQLGLLEGSERSRGSFFFNRNVRRVAAQTQPVTIRVMALPPGSPPAFDGAVGHFSMEARLSRRRLSTDEVTSLRISITGSGDIKRVPPPRIDFPPSFERYEPRVVEENSFEINGRINSRKTFEYLAQPAEPGTFSLQPRFAYFDPDSAAYVVLGDETFDLEVSQGEARTAAVLPETVPPIARDIRFLKPPRALDRPTSGFFGRPLFWGLSALPFLLLAGMLVTRRIQDRKDRLDPSERRRRLASKQAQQRLREARALLDQGKTRACYDEISKALLGYVSDKMHIPRSDLSKRNVRDKLEQLEVDPALTDRFLELLETCELALFGGNPSADSLQSTYQEAAELLTRIEQALR